MTKPDPHWDGADAQLSTPAGDEHPHTTALRKILEIRKDPEVLPTNESSKMLFIAASALAAFVPSPLPVNTWVPTDHEVADGHAILTPQRKAASDFAIAKLNEWYGGELTELGRDSFQEEYDAMMAMWEWTVDFPAHNK